MPRHGEVFRDKAVCKDCRNEYTWIYQYTEKGSSSVYKMPKKGVNEEFLNYLGDNNSRCYCPKCGYNNSYEITPC